MILSPGPELCCFSCSLFICINSFLGRSFIYYGYLDSCYLYLYLCPLGFNCCCTVLNCCCPGLSSAASVLSWSWIQLLLWSCPVLNCCSCTALGLCCLVPMSTWVLLLVSVLGNGPPLLLSACTYANN